MQETLQSFGLAVTSTQDGAGAITHLQKAAPPPDLIILDMTMPVMGGAETFIRLREIQPDVAILVYSGFALEHPLRIRFRESGSSAQAVHQRRAPEMVGQFLQRGENSRTEDEPHGTHCPHSSCTDTSGLRRCAYTINSSQPGWWLDSLASLHGRAPWLLPSVTSHLGDHRLVCGPSRLTPGFLSSITISC